MEHLPAWAWLVIAGIGIAAVIGVLLPLAAVVRDETEMARLRERVSRLRTDQRRRLMAQSEFKGVVAGEEAIEVEEVKQAA